MTAGEPFMKNQLNVFLCNRQRGIALNQWRQLHYTPN